MQAAVNSAAAEVASILATRPAAEKLLKAAHEKRDEARALEQAEDEAAQTLETLRADAFLLPSNSPKRGQPMKP